MFSTADLEKMSISDLKVTGFPPRGFGVVNLPISARPSWKDWP